MKKKTCFWRIETYRRKVGFGLREKIVLQGKGERWRGGWHAENGERGRRMGWVGWRGGWGGADVASLSLSSCSVHARATCDKRTRVLCWTYFLGATQNLARTWRFTCVGPALDMRASVWVRHVLKILNDYIFFFVDILYFMKQEKWGDCELCTNN